MSHYLSVCRKDFTCFSCGLEFKLPDKQSRLTEEKIPKKSRKRKIQNFDKNSKNVTSGSLIPSRKKNAKVQNRFVGENSSQILEEAPPIEIENVGHESSNDDKMIEIMMNDDEITTICDDKSNINNNRSDNPTKIENIDRFLEQEFFTQKMKF